MASGGSPPPDDEDIDWSGMIEALADMAAATNRAADAFRQIAAYLADPPKPEER